jgi:hypothetical protein
MFEFLDQLNSFSEGKLGIIVLRIFGASLLSNAGHFILQYTIKPKWYKEGMAYLVCLLLSILYAYLDSTGESWQYILKIGLVCSGGAMIAFYIGHKYGDKILKALWAWITRKFSKKS